MKVFFSILTLFLMGEAISRFLFPNLIGIQYQWGELGLVPKPSAQGWVSSPWLYRYHFRHDSLGFRETKHPLNGKQLLLLGDSMVYGVGVNDEDSFPALLQKIAPEIVVLNGGAPGRGPKYYRRFLSGNREEDVIWIFFTGYNDWKDSHEPELNLESNWWTHSRLAVLSMRVIAVFKGNILRYLAQRKQLANPGPVLYQDGKRLLCEIHEILLNRKTPHRFFFLPGPEEVNAFRENRKVGTEVAFEKAAKECGFEAFDLTDVLAGSPSMISDLFNLRDLHLTPQGNRLVASYLESQLKGW